MAYRGKHRKHSTAGRTVAKVALAGAVVATPIAIGAPAQADTSLDWDQLAKCESSGNWHNNTGNGFYGGLQFTQSTWQAYGGTQYASRADMASREQQISVAQKVLQRQGPGAWPACSKKVGTSTSSPVQAEEDQAPATAPSSPAGNYTVATGDTLAGIAQKLNIPGGWQELYEKNKQAIGNPTLIFPGQQLVTA